MSLRSTILQLQDHSMVSSTTTPPAQRQQQQHSKAAHSPAGGSAPYSQHSRSYTMGNDIRTAVSYSQSALATSAPLAWLYVG